MKRQDADSRERVKPEAPEVATSSLCTRQQSTRWGVIFGVLAFLIHLPFTFRYDLYFGSDLAILYMIPLRMLKGEFSIYLWGQDYMGLGPVDFLTAIAFRIFGASIPLAGSIVLLFWAAGIGLLVAYVADRCGREAAIGSGLALAIGAPYFIKFSTQVYSTTYDMTPLYTGGFLWLAFLVLRTKRLNLFCALTGLIMGWLWYANKQVIIVWLAIGVSFMLFAECRAFLGRFVRSRSAVFFLIAFLIGYSPELLFKAGLIPSRYERAGASGNFFKPAPPELQARNWYMLIRCLPTYFDADPWSRSPNSVHYLNHMENWESFPLTAVDTIGLIAACIVIASLLREVVAAYRRKDLGVFMLTMVPVVNAFLIFVTSRADGSYYNIRRYILTGGVVLVAWLGVELGRSWKSRRWWSAGWLSLLLCVFLFHQGQMLQLPDELADYKKTVADIEQSGYHYGLSWYSYSHTLTALSRERVPFGIVDRKFESPYQKEALQQNEVAFVWPARTAPPFEFAQKLFFGDVRIRDDAVKTLPAKITVLGQSYERIGEPRIIGELGWAPYRRVN